jgi:outer membrane protein TolC
MRGIFETLGATLDWDAQNRIAKATKGDMNISVEIGSYFAKKNGQVIQLDVQPIIQDGRTMVPLRFVSEALGADVQWSGDTRTVTITTANISDSTSNNGNTNNQEAMTYEKAINTALENSKTLKGKELDLEKAEELYDNAYLTPGNYNPVLIKTKDGYQTSKEWAEKSVDMTKESIEYQVRNAMDSINTLKREIAVKKFEINTNQEKLRIGKLKEENGVESGFNLDMLTKSQDQLSKEAENLQLSLNDAYLTLNNLLGLGQNERYLTQEDISYKPLGDIDIDNIVNDQLNSDPYIWYYQQQIDSAKLGLKLYEYNTSGDTYKAKEIDVATADNDLKQLKQSLEETLRSRYNQIKELEKKYDIQKINLEKAQKSLEVVQKKYDLGMAIKADVQDAELQVEQLNYSQKSLAMQHEQLVKTLYKSYLNPTYAK